MCTISATDLELSILTECPAVIESPGAITIPAKAILNYAQYTTGPQVQIEVVDGQSVRCTSGKSKTVLSGESAADYPTITQTQSSSEFSLDAASLLQALNLVTFASAKNSLRPVLSGVSMKSDERGIVLAATDSYRLSEYILQTTVSGEVSCIVPVKVLDEARTILSAQKPPRRSPTEEAAPEGTRTEAQPVHILLSSQQIELRIGSTRLISRLIEGTFPDYQQIIPKQHQLQALVPVRDLSVAVKRMHYFAREVNNNLTLRFTQSSLHMHTPQTPGGKDEADIGIESNGESAIALSSSYLLDFLAHTSEDSVEIRVQDSMHPALFHLPGMQQYVHLIMPLRMQEE